MELAHKSQDSRNYLPLVRGLGSTVRGFKTKILANNQNNTF